MCILTRRSALLFLIPIAVIVLGSVFALSSLAADRDIIGDWVVYGGTTRVSNESIDVRGSVIVRDGGVLELDNCTLVINGSYDGACELRVNSTGYLEARDTKIYGSPGRIWMRFYNDSLLEGCTLEHIHASTTEKGIMLYDGNITIRDSTIRDFLGYGTVVYTNLTFVNVTTTDGQYGHMYIVNTLPSEDTRIRIEDCVFDGYKPSTGRTNLCMQIGGISNIKEMAVVIKGTMIESFTTGVYAGGSGKFTCTVEDSEVVNCYSGFNVGSSVTLRRNVIRQGCVRIQGSSYLEDNVIEDSQGGLVCSVYKTASYECLVENLTLRNITEGVRASGSSMGGWVDLTIRNSSLESVNTGFIVTLRARISIYDTKLEVGSGSVLTGSNSWIRAYTTLNPDNVYWKGGDLIVEGILTMKDESQVAVTSIDMSTPAPQTILGWEITDTGQFAIEYLYPELNIEGHDFRADMYDLWSGTSTVIEMVDNVFPEVEISYPSDMEGINASRLVVRGKYWELGSGLAHLEFSHNGTVFNKFYSFQEDRWNLSQYDLADGTYNLSVRGVDSVGNVGNISYVMFVVDTVVPTLIIDPLPGLVNQTHVMVEGRTEPDSYLLINDQFIPISTDGCFTKGIPLEEGDNTLLVVVRDPAGNVNTATFHVLRDTVAPPLTITSPSNATWTNALSVDIVGTTELGSNVSLMGEMVHLNEGDFVGSVALSEGNFHIVVSSQDKAGNLVKVVIILFVDWTTPGLTIARPESNFVVTREKELWISGDIDDPTIETVTINGKVEELFSGSFARLYVLLEGRNEFEIEVTDAAGNTNISHIVVDRDLSSPTYDEELTSIGGELVEVGGLLYSTAIVIEVHIVPDEAVIIVHRNGTLVPVAEEHHLRFHLTEGKNRVQFDIEDRVGNRGAAYDLEIFLDTTPPDIILFEPISGYSTEYASIIFHGRTEDGSELVVGTTQVDLMSGGEFRRSVDLEVGMNEITIAVVDAMGNRNSTVISIIREEVESEDERTSLVWIIGSTIAILAGCLLLGYIMIQRHRGSEQQHESVDHSISSKSEVPLEVSQPGEEDSDVPEDWKEF